MIAVFEIEVLDEENRNIYENGQKKLYRCSFKRITRQLMPWG